MQPIYFIPDCDREDRPTLTALGFYDRLEGLACRPTTAGPDGRAGLLVASSCGPPASRPSLVEEIERTWVAARPGGDRAEPLWYLALDPAGRPSPEDLLRTDGRAEVLHRRPVILGDGQTWQIPVAARPDDRGALGSTLPARCGLDAEGRRTWAVEDRWACLWTMALRVAVDVATPVGQDRQAEPLTLDEGLAILAEALAATYRLGPVEVALLGLYSESTSAEAFWTLIGGREKKTT